MTLVSSFVDLVQQTSFVMTVPTFANFVTVLTGWVFARRRTVTGMILAADAVEDKHHSVFHRVFAAARWSLDELGLAIFGLIQQWIDGDVVLAIDDTLARKRGLKVFGVGMHHDPLLSTRRTAITNWGHSWVVVGVIIHPGLRDDPRADVAVLSAEQREAGTMAQVTQERVHPAGDAAEPGRRQAVGVRLRGTLQHGSAAQCHRVRGSGGQAGRPRAGDLRRAGPQAGGGPSTASGSTGCGEA